MLETSLSAEELLTPAQAAEILKVHKATILRHAKAGTLKSYRIARAIRFSRQQLFDFLNTQQGV